VRELLDKELIREVLYMCCRVLDRSDVELLKSAYHPEGFNVHGPNFVGNAHDFCDWVVPRLRVHEAIRHSIGNVLIDLRGAGTGPARQHSPLRRRLRTGRAPRRVRPFAGPPVPPHRPAPRTAGHRAPPHHRRGRRPGDRCRRRPGHRLRPPIGRTHRRPSDSPGRDSAAQPGSPRSPVASHSLAGVPCCRPTPAHW